jgi:hypothetical protein
VLQDAKGDIIVKGSQGFYEPFIMKMDLAGKIKQRKLTAPIQDLFFNKLSITNNGNYFISGYGIATNYFLIMATAPTHENAFINSSACGWQRYR